MINEIDATGILPSLATGDTPSLEVLTATVAFVQLEKGATLNVANFLVVFNMRLA